MGKDSFILYLAHWEPIQGFTDEQLGSLFRAIYAYQQGEDPQVSGEVAVAFAFFKQQFQIDDAKYRNRCNRASSARKARWSPVDENDSPEESGEEDEKSLIRENFSEKSLIRENFSEKSLIRENESDSSSENTLQRKNIRKGTNQSYNDNDNDNDNDNVCVLPHTRACAREESHTHMDSFLPIFFFRNLQDPQSEAERFIAHFAPEWKDRNGVPLDTDEKRANKAYLWTPDPAKPGKPRFPQDFLDAWHRIYDIAPPDIRALMVARNVKLEQITGGGRQLTAPEGFFKWFNEHKDGQPGAILREWLRGARITFRPARR